jgi:hypothetical protein
MVIVGFFYLPISILNAVSSESSFWLAKLLEIADGSKQVTWSQHIGSRT